MGTYSFRLKENIHTHTYYIADLESAYEQRLYRIGGQVVLSERREGKREDKSICYHIPYPIPILYGKELLFQKSICERFDIPLFECQRFNY